MYNRYMRNDDGSYTRVPEEEPGRRSPRERTAPDGGQDGEHGGPPPSGSGQQEHDRPPKGSGPFYGPPPPTGGRGPADGLTGFLRHFLDQWHLDSVDTGDLLLLGLLFFLFREDADEELLVALGLLLIL